MMIQRTFKSVLGTALLATITTLVSPAVHAGEPDWPARTVTLQAQEQPLADFLRALFRDAGLRTLPSDSVTGRISGRFADRPDRIFNNVVKAYDLLPYYDGTVMHISASKDMQSKSIRVAPADIDRVTRTLNASGLVDRYQSIQVLRESGTIKLRGAPEFITDMEELIGAQAPRARKTAAAATAPVIERVAERPVTNTLVFRSFPLKYASAADQTFYQNGNPLKVPGVVSLLRSMTGVGGASVTSVGPAPTMPGQAVPSVRGQGLRRYDPAAPEGQAEPAPQGEQAPAPEAAGEVVTERGSVVRIEADPNQNAVIVRDYQDSMQLYQDLIAQLDKEPQLIEIQVTIVDIDRTKLKDLGVDLRFSDQRNLITAGGGNIGVQNGGLVLNTVLGDAGNFLARVNALARKGTAQVISRPQVLTLSNLEAVLSNDQSFFVRVAGREDVDLFDVQFGSSLRVVPVIAGDPNDPQIRLRVAIEDGSLSDKTVDGIPIVDRARLNTQAVIYNGESLLLGGLVRDETTKDTTKVPGLGDVPGVGRLFKRTVDTKSTQERLFLISPRIVTSDRTTLPARTPPAAPPAPPPAGIVAGAPVTPGSSGSATTTQQASRNGN
jgi:type III secretion protein C